MRISDCNNGYEITRTKRTTNVHKKTVHMIMKNDIKTSSIILYGLWLINLTVNLESAMLFLLVPIIVGSVTLGVHGIQSGFYTSFPLNTFILLIRLSGLTVKQVMSKSNK